MMSRVGEGGARLLGRGRELRKKTTWKAKTVKSSEKAASKIV